MDNVQVELVLENLDLPPHGYTDSRGTEVIVVQSRAEEPLDEFGEPEWVAGDLKAWILDPYVDVYGIPGL